MCSMLAFCSGLLFWIGGAGPAQAAGIVTILPDQPLPNQPATVLADPVTGELMDGASVTVQYFNSPFFGPGLSGETVTFQATGTPGQGQALGTHFSLELTGDSSTNDWIITISSNLGSGLVTQMVIDLFPGGAAWDRTLPSPGTPGSGPGQDFTLTGFSTLSDFDITYLGALVPGAGETFRTLVIDMNMDVSDTASFRADTDVVPEPATAFLVGLGLMGLGARRRVSG